MIQESIPHKKVAKQILGIGYGWESTPLTIWSKHFKIHVDYFFLDAEMCRHSSKQFHTKTKQSMATWCIKKNFIIFGQCMYV